MKQLFSGLGTGKQQSFLEKNALGEHALLLLAIQQQPLDPLSLLYHRKSICGWPGSCSLYNLFQEKNRAEVLETGRMSGLFLA